MKKKIAAYVHIPFCEHLCYYCDFNKVFLEGQPIDPYIKWLLKEIKWTLDSICEVEVPTIYIGGGTPTSLTAKQLDQLLSGIRSLLPFQTGNEFTIEANPGDVTQEKLTVLKNYGVNRISLGVQTFDDQLLKKIGRVHTAKDVFQTLHLLEKNGLENVSIDLIYALPTQTMTNFRETLATALSLDLPHYSLYSLILENKTQFMNCVRSGRMELPSDDLATDMFEETLTFMKSKNIQQYEISNFAKAGFESKHNLVYWNNDSYFGFGAGASGYVGNCRSKNFSPIQHYLNPLRKGQLPIRETEALSISQQMEEEMFLGLRKRAGVSKQIFLEKYGQSVEEIYGTVINELKQKQLIVEDDQSIRITEKSLFIGNVVFESFLLNNT